MTSLAFILGVLPLFVATAGMRHVLGTGVFYGTIGVTFFSLVFTPLL